MKNTANKITGSAASGMLSIDTTFVLFFLALEYGRGVQLASIDGLLMGITLLMVLVLPYFLPSQVEKPSFNNWLAGRCAIALLGAVLGVAFSMSIGVVLPDSLRFMPLTFLILASMISCYIQFYSLLRLRPAK
ncbi:hypothetical protein BH10ACI2_BH10ACI2_16520 [soil metagenome]